MGAYHLSEEFIEQLMLGKEYEFDEETLSEAGLTILPDRKYRGEKFIGIQRMGREEKHSVKISFRKIAAMFSLN